MWYVYHLIDPRDGLPFYVGKGCRGRILSHEQEAKKGRISPKCDRIRQIWALNLSVEKKKIKHFSCEQSAYDFERDEISRIGLSSLTNLIPGGGSASTREDILRANAVPEPVVKFIADLINAGITQDAVVIRPKHDGPRVSHVLMDIAEAAVTAWVPTILEKWRKDPVEKSKIEARLAKYGASLGGQNACALA